METKSKGSLAAKLRWAKFRYEKGNATMDDLNLLGKLESVEIKDHKEKVKTMNNFEPLVENSKNFKDVSIDGFIEDAQEHTRSDFSANDFFEADSEAAENLNENSTGSTAKMKGATILFFIDMVFPSLLVLLYSKISKGKKIDASDLKMDESEKAELESVANEVAEKIGYGTDNPIYQLLIGLTIIYGSKMYMAIQMNNLKNNDI